MAQLDPTVALNLLENALRDLMEHAYRAEWGDAWLEKVSTEKQRTQWEGRAQAEQGRTKKGVIAVPAAGLAYGNLYDLVEIANKQWQPLAPALGNMADCLPLIRRADSLRNTVAHGRLLVTHERDLLAGIAGQIRNQVTIYMSSQDPAGDIYPRIERIVDSYGLVLIGDTNPLKGILQTGVVLHVGDVVDFTCFGTDPQGRDLLWILQAGGVGSDAPPVTGPSGAEVRLVWSVEDGHVTESHWVEIKMSAAGTRYHRNGHCDQTGTFGYAVRPPRGGA